MSPKSYYAQKCPTCQKMLSVDVKTLGFSIVCCHCKSEFTAKDQSQSSAAIEDPINFWINFTDHGDATGGADSPHAAETFLSVSPHRRPK